jgi:hypothetical protein
VSLKLAARVAVVTGAAASFIVGAVLAVDGGYTAV